MRVLAAWAAACLSVAWAQQTETEPAPQPVLTNTGKPMVVDCQCDEQDIHSAGLSCTMDDPCPLFLELDSVEAVGNRIFLAGNIHSPTTTLYSAMLASDDAGKTWREPYERMRAAGLDRIQFIDFQNGWISGEFEQPLPHDPFLLTTADGGKSWHARPVFADPQFGSVLEFAFSSRTNGSMVIDRGKAGESGRYELYETPDAGEMWMLRQTNERPIALKHAADVNADWRLRADAATKSYRVEHRTGNSWRSVAAFAVTIGVCKPPEVPAAPVDGGDRGPQKPAYSNVRTPTVNPFSVTDPVTLAVAGGSPPVF